VLVTLANFFAEVFKQSFLPTLKMRCQHVGKRAITVRCASAPRTRRPLLERTHTDFIYILWTRCPSGPAGRRHRAACRDNPCVVALFHGES
jgi:hypothetical protein